MPVATHQADAIVAAAALGDGHRFWVVPSARAGELGVLTRPLTAGGWQWGGGRIGISPSLLQGRLTSKSDAIIANALISELLRQATQRE